MSRRVGSIGGLVACAHLGIILTAGTVGAQTVVVSTNSRVIATQLRAAVQLEQKALEKLAEPKALETLDEVVPLANQAYVLIRAAREGMMQSKAGRKFVDPLLDYQIAETTRAWNMARGPVDQAYDAMPRSDYLANSANSLNSVIAILEGILQVLPQ